ncbi:ligase-associated DNA damage response endonuclease PdeM [Loktanella sp. SALINAS62]|uniref:ligase-associated DNA damage response endonuclease PdeM n=1 Tax=Loktanella sp. SALINAS62 TaxID=2706124 RepID=UPI001B8AFF77|nr:ligase-associated DNA damage response endonuclease PdeM [Loktanella sp. SALINAS62]MBS1300844.1 ligase-associated DNA damage response endonuclease PdeM [Loktanella sp. SALINAS62]
MNAYDFTICDDRLTALPSGALWWAAERLLCVSDLHLCKSDRVARRSGQMLPPYETRETLARLSADIAANEPATVICLGDSFDDLDAARSLSDADIATLTTLQAGRDWIWIEGNHDPGPVALGGSHLADHRVGRLVFRHIATPDKGEVSGHYHPKHAIPGAGGARPCFLFDDQRLILPAYGAYTGGLHASHPVLSRLFGPQACAILTGRRAICVPVRPSAPLARPGHWRGNRR